MFRKMTLIAIPAVACALTLFGSNDMTSQAFARGGMGGRSFGYNHRGFHRNFHNRSFGRYFGWGYPGYYSYASYPSCECSTVTEPVTTVAETPVCTTCEPVVSTVSTCEPTYVSGYASSWGFGRYHHHYDHHRFHPLYGGAHRGGRGR